MDGTAVATSKIEDGQDGVLDVQLPSDGVCVLVVEELNLLGGPDFVYGVEVAEFEPGFELSVESDRAQVKPGGEFSIKVLVDRREYEGAVTLAVEGLGEGVELKEEVVAAKKNEATLKIRMPGTWMPSALEHFSIRGTARIGERTHEARASLLPALRKSHPETRRFPPELEHRIALWRLADPGPDSDTNPDPVPGGGP
jgi:hypothetical protein